jgi:hypothetical protein
MVTTASYRASRLQLLNSIDLAEREGRLQRWEYRINEKQRGLALTHPNIPKLPFIEDY